MRESDHNLLERWRTQRDAAAFKLLAERHAGMVYAACHRILNNAAEAEEVAQECFEALAMTRKHTVRDSVGAWLHGAAVKRSLQRQRSEGRRKKREQRYAEQQPQSREVVWDDIYDLVDEAIAKLPAKFQEPLVAHYLEGQKKTAIALNLGVANATISYRIEKGIQLVRKQLKKRGVAVTAPVLAALFKAHPAEAAPPALSATLGKIALAGVEGAGATSGVAILSTVVTLVFLLTGGAYLIHQLRSDTATESFQETISASEIAATTTTNTPDDSHEPKENILPAALPESTTPLSDSLDAVHTLHGITVNTQGHPVAEVMISCTSSGKPIPMPEKAAFHLPDTGHPIGFTDELGRFTVEEITMKKHVLYFHHPKYQMKELTLTPGMLSGEEPRVILEKGGTLTGIVTLDDEPVADQQVELNTPGFFGSGFYKRVRTNADGVYHFHQIRAGNWLLSARLQQPENDENRRTMETPAWIEQGKTTVADFSFTSCSAGLKGQIAIQGTPLPDKPVTVVTQSEEGAEEKFVVSCDPEGYYAFTALPEGKAFLVVQDLRIRNSIHTKIVPITLSAGRTTTQNIDLRGNGVITVYCQTPDYIDNPDFNVALVAEGATESLSEGKFIRSMIMLGMEAFHSILADGEEIEPGVFRIEGVEEGSHTLCAAVQEGGDWNEYFYDYTTITLAEGESIEVYLGAAYRKEILEPPEKE